MLYANVLLLRCPRFNAVFTAEAPVVLTVAYFNATAMSADPVSPSAAS